MVKDIKVISKVSEPIDPLNMRNPLHIAAFWLHWTDSTDWYDPNKECMTSLFLNARNQITAVNLVSLGTATASLAHPREVFKPAILAGACSIILVHNHPSGSTDPSSEDLSLTRRMVEAGKIIGIPILDHLIISSNEDESFTSLNNENLMK